MRDRSRRNLLKKIGLALGPLACAVCGSRVALPLVRARPLVWHWLPARLRGRGGPARGTARAPALKWACMLAHPVRIARRLFGVHHAGELPGRAPGRRVACCGRQHPRRCIATPAERGSSVNRAQQNSSALLGARHSCAPPTEFPLGQAGHVAPRLLGAVAATNALIAIAAHPLATSKKRSALPTATDQ